MKNIKFIFSAIIIFIAISAKSQTNEGTFWKPNPANYEVKHAFEVESLFPMYFYGGYHVAVGYRYKKFRIRASVIDGGTFNSETSGLNNSSPDYKRYYKPGYGIFPGYNVWKNLDIYGYLENHTFEIEQVSTGEKTDIKSFEGGVGLSYQFFIGRTFYVQPGFHSYYRADNSVEFSDKSVYDISNIDLTFVMRVGVRLYKKY